jgi:hypothetical protein
MDCVCDKPVTLRQKSRRLKSRAADVLSPPGGTGIAQFTDRLKKCEKKFEPPMNAKCAD